MGNGASGGGCLSTLALVAGAIVLAPALAIYGLITGRKQSKQLEKPRLPYLATGRMNAADRPALERARKTAQLCIDSLYSADASGEETSELVAREVSTEVLELVKKIYELGQRLAEARTYVKRHDTDKIAREQADLELKMQESRSHDEGASLQEAMDALEERARHSASVSMEIRTLSARLTAAVNGLEALQARLTRLAVEPEQSTAGSEALVEELRAQQRDTGRALEAYSSMAREIGKIRG